VLLRRLLHRKPAALSIQAALHKPEADRAPPLPALRSWNW
jgi:hypothetical protein